MQPEASLSLISLLLLYDRYEKGRDCVGCGVSGPIRTPVRTEAADRTAAGFVEVNDVRTALDFGHQHDSDGSAQCFWTAPHRTTTTP